MSREEMVFGGHYHDGEKMVFAEKSKLEKASDALRESRHAYDYFLAQKDKNLRDLLDANGRLREFVAAMSDEEFVEFIAKRRAVR